MSCKAKLHCAVISPNEGKVHELAYLTVYCGKQLLNLDQRLIQLLMTLQLPI